MSNHINDENNDSYNDLFHSVMPIGSQLDSGYLTLTTSSCLTSPSRLSPSSVILNQNDSPISEYDIQSPINAPIKKFLTKIDYEHYILTRKHFDILTQLYHRNAYHIIDKIYENLANNDLNSCSNVCRKWYSILKDYYRRQQTKTVKRNLFHNFNKTPIKKIQYKTKPMQTITNLLDNKTTIPYIVETNNEENILSLTPSQNIFTSSPDNNIHLSASTMTFRYGYLKYLHGPTIPKRCPICAYVSIVDVNDQHGICTNPLCRNSFCQCCSGPYHPSSPCKTTTGPIKSPWRQRPAISPIFSNKTRNNLRRLLI
ncbi:unnamed protein product [Rotaria sp. Silwood1]|nr:unnamed protein product [Rotaria sp. Silwood1]CAF3396589.1 unnamed protein product [Rotaria sp. Silwood1]CAF4564965.1 unnamed protein product [Rotaria sp. Silwood1]